MDFDEARRALQEHPMLILGVAHDIDGGEQLVAG
jgi:hypothetical protein